MICFYFYSIITLKSHCFSLHERFTIADWWNAVSRLALVRSEAEQLMTYLIVSTSKILYPNCTSHTSCFVLQLTPILSHASFPDAWRLLQQKSKQPEKGPRWQLRGVRGEARTRITINEVNRIPAKCAVRTVFAQSLVVLRSCWAGEVVITMWKWSLSDLMVEHMFLEIRDENFLSTPPSHKSVTSANLNRASASSGRVQGYTSGNIFYFPRGGRDMARRNIFWRNLVS